MHNPSPFALYILGSIAFLFFAYLLFLSAPWDFQPGAIVKIERGNSLRDVSLKLKGERIIRSRLTFEALVIIYGGERHIVYSDYLFENKLPVFEVARRITKGEHHLPPIAVTIPEGYNNAQIGDAFASRLTDFDKNKFFSEAGGMEGYLFPDTYFFFSTNNEQDVLKSMSENFGKKIAPLRGVILSSGRTEKEIIVMASLIEREAKGDSDRGSISGILWKRLDASMPLQVDAAPETYKTKGLPERPISNPGLASIKATLYPEKSPYLYYLHDKNGDIHYARNFEEHKINKRKYLSENQ